MIGVIVARTVTGAELDPGFAAFKNGAYAQASSLLVEPAQGGDALAAAALAVIAERGLAGTVDPQRAIRWYERAAAAGLTDAQADLAAHYYRGELVARDLERARHWWRIAADAGDSRSLASLAALDAAQHARPVTTDPIPAPDLPAGAPATAMTAEPLGRDWILAQPAANYTVQLASGEDAQAIRRFLQTHPLPAPAAYFKAATGTGARHTAILGSFIEVSAARGAIDKLPDAIKARSPWIRKFSDVQAQAIGP